MIKGGKIHTTGTGQWQEIKKGNYYCYWVITAIIITTIVTAVLLFLTLRVRQGGY